MSFHNIIYHSLLIIPSQKHIHQAEKTIISTQENNIFPLKLYQFCLQFDMYILHLNLLVGVVWQWTSIHIHVHLYSIRIVSLCIIGLYTSCTSTIVRHPIIRLLTKTTFDWSVRQDRQVLVVYIFETWHWNLAWNICESEYKFQNSEGLPMSIDHSGQNDQTCYHIKRCY